MPGQSVPRPYSTSPIDTLDPDEGGCAMSPHASGRFSLRSRRDRFVPSPRRRHRSRAVLRPLVERLEERSPARPARAQPTGHRSPTSPRARAPACPTPRSATTTTRSSTPPSRCRSRCRTVRSTPSPTRRTRRPPRRPSASTWTISAISSRAGRARTSRSTATSWSRARPTTARCCQAQAQEFGYSSTITTADAEFDVRLTITGGLLTQSGGPYHVGDSLGLLIHQPGLTIGSFPQSFSVSNSLLGTSDTAHLPPQQFCLSTRAAGDEPHPAADHRAQPEFADHRSAVRCAGRMSDLRPASTADMTSERQSLGHRLAGRRQRHDRSLRRLRHHAGPPT